MGERVGRMSSRSVSMWSRSLGGCGSRGVFSVGRDFSVIYFSEFFFFERTRPVANMRSPCFIYLSTSDSLRELYVADFHKLGIYGSRRVWANAWDVFHHMPSRGGRGHRAALAFVVCFRWGGFLIFCDFFFRVFVFSSNAHRLLQV